MGDSDRQLEWATRMDDSDGRLGWATRMGDSDGCSLGGVGWRGRVGCGLAVVAGSAASLAARILLRRRQQVALTAMAAGA